MYVWDCECLFVFILDVSLNTSICFSVRHIFTIPLALKRFKIVVNAFA